MDSSRFVRAAVVLFALAAAPLVRATGSITVTPANESVALGGTKQYTATVTGLPDSTVVWAVNGTAGGSAQLGTINTSGLYTAPASAMTPLALTITATSAMDSTVQGSAHLAVKSPGPTLTSATPSTFPAGMVTFTINGSGFLTGAVAYLNNVSLPTTVVSGTQVKGTGYAGTAGNYSLRVMNPGTMFSNVLTVRAYNTGGGGTLTVSPSTASVPTGLTQQFTALWNGSPVQATWSVSGGAAFGTVTTAGLYKAPAAIPNPATATVTATYSTGATASATVTIVSNTPPSITSLSPAQVPLGVFSLTVNGAGFTTASTATVGGAPMATQYVSPSQLTCWGYSGQGGSLNVTVANGPLVSAPAAVQVGVPNPQVSPGAARRFLEQAAFGPTPADASHVQQVGFSGWLNEQFALGTVSNYQMSSTQGGMPQRYLTNAVMNGDQLRQKVAFALSQILVTSIVKVIWNQTMIPYQEMLLADAFSNYRTILNDVTLNAAMGQFLDMANNGKASGSMVPNENFAREVMQLFTTGTSLLNQDGSLQTDGQGNPIPTYTQFTVTELARVFTGWTYAPAPGQPVVWNAYISTNGPMVPYAPQHDTGSKTLLNGVVLPAGQTAQQDLAAALDNLFNHPNTGPFVGKQLIQHLVKSNPSPAYIARVAAAFNDNGQGVRGDMKAVITAILLDAEARQNDAGGNDQPSDGHLQEPALFLPALIRAFGGQMNDQNYFSYDLSNMSQDIFDAPSVFNYYSPNYVVPAAGITGGEFQIHSPYTAVYRANLVSGLFSNYTGNVQTYGPGTTVDLTGYVNIAGNPATLVDALDLALTHGQMPAALKQMVVTAVQAETGGNLRRVQTGIYLITTSGYYNVWH